MARAKALTKTQLASAVQGFALAGFPPNHAVVKRDSTTIFFNTDLPDDIFESDDPDAALAKWERENEKH